MLMLFGRIKQSLLQVKKTRHNNNAKRILVLALTPLRFLYKQRLLVLIALCVSFVIFASYILAVYKRLPNIQDINIHNETTSSIIYDEKNNELFRYYTDINKEFLSLEKFPDEVKSALLSAEDKRFYHHSGVDWVGTIRCGYYTLTSFFGSNNICGASTITQQVADIALKEYGYKSSNRISKKIEEIVFAFKIENQLSKNEILELYCNEVPLGGQIYGVSAAASAYFQKKTSDLSIAEAALLAGMIHSPTALATNSSTEFSQEILSRKNDILLKMYTNTFINKDEYNNAINTNLVFNVDRIIFKAPHFSIKAKQYIESSTDDFSVAGLSVKTTLNPKIQSVLEEAVTNYYITNKINKADLNVGAIWISPNDAAVKGLVGSSDYYASSAEVAGAINIFDTTIQPGSTIKPLLYLSAFKRGFTPYTVLLDSKELGYNLSNPTNDFAGITNARESLSSSRNVATRYLFSLINKKLFFDDLKSFHIATNTWESFNESEIVAGQVEMHFNDLIRLYLYLITGDNNTRLKYIESVNNKPFANQKVTNNNSVLETQYINWILCNTASFPVKDPQLKTIEPSIVEKTCLETGASAGAKDRIAISYGENYLLITWLGKSNGQKTTTQNEQNAALEINKTVLNKIQNTVKLEKKHINESLFNESSVCIDTGKIKGKVDCIATKMITPKDKPPAADTRKSLSFCKSTNIPATNAGTYSTAKFFYKKVAIYHKIDNSDFQSLYNKLATASGKFAVNPPTAADCNTVTDGVSFVSNSEIVLSGFGNGTKIYPGASIPLTISVSQNQNIGSVSFTIDGKTVDYTFTSYAKNYAQYSIDVAPSALQLQPGNHNVGIQIRDKKNKIVYSKTVAFNYSL